MIEFEYLELTKRPQFKSQRFDLKKKGISLILGHNKRTKSTNGVGKSYFFGELPDLLTGGESTGTRQDRVRKGSVKIGVKKGKKRYEFEQVFSPREVLNVYEDGVNKEFRELKEARAFMEGVIPYSEQAVASFLYLDLANSVHPLISGTTAMRKAFFRDFFKQMDAVGPIRKLVDSAHSEIAHAGTRVTELESELEGLSELADPAPIKKKVARLQLERDEFSEKLALVTAALTVYRRLKEVREGLGDPTFFDSHSDPAAEIKTMAKDTRRRRAELDAYREWFEENAQLEGEIAELTQALAEFKVPKNPQGAYERVSTQLSELNNAVYAYNQALKTLNREKVEADTEIQEIQEKLTSLNEKQGTCPTCGGDYHDKHLDERIQKLTEHLSTWKKQRKEIKVKLSELTEPEGDVKELESLLERLTEYLDTSRRLEKLKTKATTRPDKPEDTEKTVSRAEAQVEDLRERLHTYEEMKQLEKDWAATPSEIRRLAKSDDLHAEFVKKNDELNELKLQLQALENQWEQRTRLEAELAEKRSEVKLKKYLDILKQAFSPKGVEKEMISMACSMLEDQVNKFAKLVFSEDFRFYFEMESNFTITVERNYGKKQMVSDVRKLSGAEKRLFSLVLVVALLSFVPPATRPNILVLDEPTATMGEDNKAAFVRFLPVLNKVIPHLIVITPLKPHDFAHLNPSVYTVVKDGATSYIVEGVVDANTKLPSRA